jgi:hypothetical protein
LKRVTYIRGPRQEDDAMNTTEKYEVYLKPGLVKLIQHDARWLPVLRTLAVKEVCDHEEHSPADSLYWETRLRAIINGQAQELALIIDRRGKEVRLGLGHEVPRLPNPDHTIKEYDLSDEEWQRLTDAF